ncbi:hypothetical protein ACM7UT_32570, partial [Pseudomonas aeruginosa]
MTILASGQMMECPFEAAAKRLDSRHRAKYTPSFKVLNVFLFAIPCLRGVPIDQLSLVMKRASSPRIPVFRLDSYVDRKHFHTMRAKVAVDDCFPLEPFPRQCQPVFGITPFRISPRQLDTVVGAPYQPLFPVWGDQSVFLGLAASLDFIEIFPFQVEDQLSHGRIP